MKRFLLILLFVVTFSFPKTAIAGVIDSPNMYSYQGDSSYYAVSDNFITIATLNALEGYKITRISPNIFISGATWSRQGHATFRIYGDGILLWEGTADGSNRHDTTNKVPLVSVNIVNGCSTVTIQAGKGTSEDYNYSYVSNLGGSYGLGVAVADKETVIQARDAANSANMAAQGAKTSSDTAAARAQTSINQTWYTGFYGGAHESTADLAGYIRNTQYKGSSNICRNPYIN